MPAQFERPYLDSSVYISAIKGEGAEPGRGELSARILDLGQRGECIVVGSVFVYAEVIKDRGQPRLTEEQEEKIDRFLGQEFITWVEVDFPLAKKARGLARDLGLKPVDAVHLATAIRAGCDQLLAWDSDFEVGATVEGVLLTEPHLDWLPDPIPGTGV